MIYLLSYLGVGALTLALFIYAIYIRPAHDRCDEFAVHDLFISLFMFTLWPIAWLMTIYSIVYDAIASAFASIDGNTVLWKRKAAPPESLPGE